LAEIPRRGEPRGGEGKYEILRPCDVEPAKDGVFSTKFARFQIPCKQQHEGCCDTSEVYKLTPFARF
jgi:hypothetical protein